MKLIIAEKPSAADKIAQALGNHKRVDKNNAYYYESDDMVIVPAVGHLFGLKQSVKGSFYPVFDVRWAPTFEIDKKNAYSKKYYKNIKQFQNNVDEVFIATDYDTEGSVIGYNIYRFLFPEKKVKRMKFSTLTKKELKKSFENPMEPDIGLIQAGLTRHNLDWYYGINLSRALTTSVKETGKFFSILSIGRVQGPMLNFLAEKEREIDDFEPVPYWQMLLKFKIGKKKYEALYKKKKIWEEPIADKIKQECQVEHGSIRSVAKRKRDKKPPYPFNLSVLQRKAYQLFGYSPKQTAGIAQSLYSDAYISYPRTSSQKLPKELGLKEIVQNLKKQVKYKKFCKMIMKGDMKPRQGRKKDPAHPAIHPTGEIPKNLKSREKKIYDLIVRRFLSCFGEPAKRQSLRIKIDVAGHEFRISGSRTIKKGWMEIYEPYVRMKEAVFPDINKGDEIDVKKVEKIDKETSPPPRYSQGSILKELEQRDIGTKATRGQILDTLYNRGYIVNKSIEVTTLGMELIKALEKYAPSVIDEALTRRFEKEMEKVRKGDKTRQEVLSEARKVLNEILKDFKDNEKRIGKILDKAVMETRRNKRRLGKCPKCGGYLKLIFMRKRKTRFVGCSSYPKCKNAYPVPQSGFIKKTDKVCDKCGTPIIYVFRKGKRPFSMCLDPDCETKEEWNKDKKKGKKGLESKTKKEIYEIAKKLDISGRSKMSKSDLIKAVKKARKNK